jgi:membrane-associated protein
MLAVQQISEFIHANSFFAGPLSFTVTVFGCLVGTNLVVPAGAIITAMGILAGAGLISFGFVPWAICGAALGMSASYTLGARFGLCILNLPLLQPRLELMARATGLFAQYGFVAIFIGYYSGPLRALVAVVAAMAHMSRGKFELANILAAIVWTICSISIGALPGTMVPPDSVWLPISVVLVPLLTIAISAAILFLRTITRGPPTA